MAPQDRNLDSDAADDEGEGEGLDFERIKLLAGFFLRAQSRHRFVGPLVFAIIAALTVTVTILWPRVYEVDFRLLAQKNNLLPALGNPTRTVRDNDSPTKNVQETVIQRDNLVALVKQVDLIDRWDASRAPILRIKDKIMNAISGPTSEEDKMHALIGLMQQRLWVTPEDSALTFTVVWPSPQIAFEISSIIEQNFLEAKYDNEVSVIREAIRILDDRAKDQAKQVDAALADLTKLEAEQKAKAETSAGLEPTPAPAPVVPTPAGAPAAVTTRVVKRAPAVPVRNEAADQLEDVRKQIAALEATRAHDLADAQKQLSDARLTLGPMHPTVVALKQKVDEFADPDPTLAGLKTQEHQLVAAIAATPPASDDDSSAGTVVRTYAPRASSRASSSSGDSKDAVTRQLVERLTDRDDAATAFAKTKLTAASAKYNELLTRLEAAQIELDVAKAAFKFKYEVVRPPEFPKKPRKPNVPVLLLGGLLAALALAFLIPGLVDLASGRLVEPWQAQSALKIPVIGILLPPGS